MKALIDGDILVYRCGFAAQHTNYKVYVTGEEEFGWVAFFDNKKEATEWVGEQENLSIVPDIEVEPLENALHNVKNSVQSILKAVKADDYEVYLTGDGNFREEIATILPYKGNRDPDYKPHWYKEIKAYLINNYGATVVDGQEADDAMSIEQYAKWNLPPSGCVDHTAARKSTCICTIDKDLDMVPGYHYNWTTEEIYWIDEVTGLRNFYKQMLTGDKPTDNIPGLFHLTKKKCTKAILKGLDELETEEDMWKYVLTTYLTDCKQDHVGYVYNKEFFREKLTEIGRLLWMRRENGQLWEPPNG